jgi:formamidopyrimidine-DNA glycosylase
MSGSLRICHPSDPLKTHDHLIWHFASDNNLAPIELRYHDPRRFGCCLWTTEAPESHHLIKNLGPEPLEATFDDDFLFKASRHKVTAIKRLLMDNHVVVGIGNIYANEALFQASIHPLAPANSLSQQQYQALSIAIRETLSRAINQGGSTLRDFVNSDGKPGYFQQTLKVYGRGGQPCTRCARRLTEIRINGRSTVFCTQCQQ